MEPHPENQKDVYKRQIQSIGRHGTKDISFTIATADLEEALKAIEEVRERLGAEEVKYDNTIAKVSIVGSGLMSNAGVASRMFEALYDVGVNIKMISTSEIKVTVLINQEDVERAVRSVHDTFVHED